MLKLMPLLFALFSIIVAAKPLETFKVHVEQTPSLLYSLDVRVGVQSPDSQPIGDILYLTGFGDRLDNHAPLFNEWVKAGFRVISFDYPSHGETTGTSLNLFSFRRLAYLATQIERATTEDVSRPLILSGWSTGGLLAVRMMQSSNFARFDRPVRGLILFAPGIAVDAIVGRPSWGYPFGEITNESLTHDPNPPHKADAKPKSPMSLSSFVFAGVLKVNSIVSQYESFPSLPTLVFVGGERSDVYAKSEGVKSWIASENRSGALINEVDLPGARHEIDNETEEFGGPKSRAMAAEFARSLVDQPTSVNANRAR